MMDWKLTIALALTALVGLQGPVAATTPGKTPPLTAKQDRSTTRRASIKPGKAPTSAPQPSTTDTLGRSPKVVESPSTTTSRDPPLAVAAHQMLENKGTETADGHERLQAEETHNASEKQDLEPGEREEETASQQYHFDNSQYKDKPNNQKGKGGGGRDKKESATAPPPKTASSPSISSAQFPHQGKHCPPPKVFDKQGNLQPALLAAATARKGAVALYSTKDTPTVLAWEQEAREKGLELSGEFTIVHAFDKTIGADQGKLTRFIRIDGDHGHPIIESGSKTSFDGYIEREIETTLKIEGDAPKVERLKQIQAYLKENKLNVSAYFKKIPKGILDQLN